MAAPGKIHTFIGDGSSSRKEMNFRLKIVELPTHDVHHLPPGGVAVNTSRDSSSTTSTLLPTLSHYYSYKRPFLVSHNYSYFFNIDSYVDF